MYRFVVLVAIFALASARVPIPSVEIETALNTNLIDFSDEQDNFWSLLKPKNSSFAGDQTNDVSNLFSFAQLTAVPSEQKVEGTIRYTLGRRVSNDRLVGQGKDSKKWPTPQDVTLTLKYPNSGVGARVTYVEIDVVQSSNVGNARVVAGGIGQRSIAIVVTAGNTYWLGYAAYIYGI